ncbi:MAG: hypothetical protein A3A24_01045 [Candidatus Buchananbacteria bacterium RIFCSPLOWO2_01_FULL_46_12]|uniref:Hydrolase TatD n=2 Tax=Candidatus Buchananiibacteriota TaxID=1817903 RepID=A0A1G1YMQ3_9BACT|nr:MAG: hypothetical protein A2744_02035 [Candidatus Buchananbacteria bacterium RIFCSPHIGHO2_01_FULL_44_11]OGY53579.1 MAG: hypothetical protein A3A24_01045 [Candidatus Buchananbacteria bacterium RIFCSPLOWO2_01_FULL_46_12]
MLVDSHCHLNFSDFAEVWQSIIADCQQKNIWLINVGSQLQTSQRAVEIAEQYPQGVYASVALHPIHVLGSESYPEDFILDRYESLIKKSKKVVAVGETGIDFFHSDKILEKQKEVFISHLNLALRFNLPVIVHGRNSQDGTKNAYEEILKILRQVQTNTGGQLRGVIHCYGGNLEQAHQFLDVGFYVGFTGIVTFKNAKDLQAVAQTLPLDRILIETDAPYLAPEPYRGQRNYPQYVELVAKKIAELKQIDYNKVVEQTAQNAIQLFKLS